jgi:hypothetical protein
MMRPAQVFLILVSLIVLLALLAGYLVGGSLASDQPFPAGQATPGVRPSGSAVSGVYLPFIRRTTTAYPPSTGAPRINVPYFDGEVAFSETAIFWFGKVNLTENYVDVRVGYTQDELFVHLAAFDRLLWYDDSQPVDLEAWDSASLYLNLSGNKGIEPDESAYRFLGALNSWEEDLEYQAGFQGNGSGWVEIDQPFTTQMGYRGNPNNDNRDNGWRLSYWIPFSSLGMEGAPPQGTLWGLAVVLHDRDDAGGTSIPDKVWPLELQTNRPETWGELVFGLPAFTSPDLQPDGSVTIRHGLDGAVVRDGAVGGGTNCGQGLDFFGEWGDTNYGGIDRVNVQNQYDLADWPCFSKIYVTFPLDKIPAGKILLTATLTLHHFGNAGGGEFGEAPASLIQVFRVSQDWQEDALTWNNAPLAIENVSQTWVEWLAEYPGWPGLPRTWDLSRAVADAYAEGEPLRLALYSADSERHSGKYFLTSDVDEDSVVGRPTLVVTWSDP